MASAAWPHTSMAGVALAVVTFVACALLLLLLHFELQATPMVIAPEALPEFLESPSPPPSPPPPPSPRPYVQPLCQVTFGRAVCMRGGKSAPCPDRVDQVRHDTQPTASGAWVLAPTYTCAPAPANRPSARACSLSVAARVRCLPTPCARRLPRPRPCHRARQHLPRWLSG